MIITIDIKDRDLIAEACTELEVNYAFYNMENNELMCRCELLIELNSGKLVDIPSATAFSIGRLVQIAWQRRLDKEVDERFNIK